MLKKFVSVVCLISFLFALFSINTPVFAEEKEMGSKILLAKVDMDVASQAGAEAGAATTAGISSGSVALAVLIAAGLIAAVIAAAGGEGKEKAPAVHAPAHH